MSAFHNDIFNRRGSSAFLSDFRQDNRSGVFAAPSMPKPLFSDSSAYGSRPQSSSSHVQQHQRSASFSGAQSHFAYVAGCEICEDYIRCGRDICYHEHRIVCRGERQGCPCHHCCAKRECVTTQVTTMQQPTRTEEAVTDSRFGNSRVRTRSATTMVGDGASFGFGRMGAEEMLRAASDNRWRGAHNTNDSFYAKPLNHCAPAAPAGHVQLRDNNAGSVFGAHAQMHAGRQEEMRADAAAHFAGHGRPMPLFSANYGAARCEEEEDARVKVTRTTTTTTTRTRKEHCEGARPVPVPVPVPEPEHHHHHHHEEQHHHHEEHHHHQHHAGTVIPIGVRPDVPIKAAEPCCTWCRFLPCLSCPRPTNANARFHKRNFRLFPEYEFLADDLEPAKPTDYFPQHSHTATRSAFKVTVPGARQIAQRIYVDFVGDQMVVIGEHGRPLPPGAINGGASAHVLARSSTRSSTLASKEAAAAGLHAHHHHHHSQPPPGVATVFAKNFFVPRDTYDRDRAQAFIKPNGNLKIVVPVLES
ncbi:hypothetical protein H4S06_003142 [Coemansia sp. BCRC 34490]|nr:hypothetical protein H4S06_003142 [Coemansia sp. BCRC 34490]